MKKVLTFACAAAFAAVTQAASLAWGAAIAKADGATAVGAGSMAYLIYSATDIFGGAPSVFDTGTGVTDLGGQLMDTHTITAGEAAGWIFTDTFVRADADGGVNGYWQMVLVDSDDPTQFAYWSTQVTGIGDSTGAGDIKYNMAWDPAGGFLGNNTQPGVVPEPTSMALLALGAAALGLRRKLRK